jgi:hypothetical protein
VDVRIQVMNVTGPQQGLTAEVIVYSANGNVYSNTSLIYSPPNKVDIEVPLGGRFEMRRFLPPVVRDANQRMAVRPPA